MLIRERRRNRLKNFDYSENGYYFVTICTKNRIEYFGNITNRKMVLNEFGQIAKHQWLWMEQHFISVKLDELVIMPNHIHGVVIIQNVGNGRDRSLQVKSLSDLIGAFKTTSSKLIHLSGNNLFQWQKSFFDHIIRNEKSLFAIRQYIRNNPLRWEEDRNNPENLLM